jgi:arsenate reductase
MRTRRRSSLIQVFGIPTCDRIRAVRKLLKASATEHVFQDVRRDPPAPDQLRVWANALGMDVLINRRGTTWRKLTDETKQNINEGGLDVQIAALIQQPEMIKRPLVVFDDGQIATGPDAQQRIAGLV